MLYLKETCKYFDTQFKKLNIIYSYAFV